MSSPNTIVFSPGTILIHESVMLLASLKIETSLYSKSWRLITTDKETLSGSIAAAGWNFFFTVRKLEGSALGILAPKTLARALRRILRQVQDMHFNAVEIVKVETHKTLGLIPYISILAHARHVQQSEQLENDEQRKTAQAQSAWAIG